MAKCVYRYLYQTCILRPKSSSLKRVEDTNSGSSPLGSDRHVAFVDFCTPYLQPSGLTGSAIASDKQTYNATHFNSPTTVLSPSSMGPAGYTSTNSDPTTILPVVQGQVPLHGPTQRCYPSCLSENYGTVSLPPPYLQAEMYGNLDCQAPQRASQTCPALMPGVLGCWDP
ncbi:hypothetical protein D9613_011572 [Agrocybe pediades]|uniref:Uncharacterized protein n=1 Tax=Agrocybe pediades TaxID=84607 RepID=A0A8H4QWN8_9AGAR|nr:hypothetical protein D9613_011572 [Agrocybe pediades]